MKILKNILTFLLILALTWFSVVSSFSFWKNQNITYNRKELWITSSIVSLATKEDKKSYIDRKVYSQDTPTRLEKWEAWQVEFGLLASAFVLADQGGILDFDHYSLSGKTLSFDPRYPAVFSLYDPFTLYSLASINNDFALTEITNGSFYVGMEIDNTISVYSIDAVIRLDFFSDGKKMTDMVLFPGMYIRFDPSMNTSLEWANLFRILQSLQPDGTQDISMDNTGIEFINPRMESISENDTFFMYRLPPTTNILFQMLHVLFYDKASQIDILKEYGTSSTGIVWTVNNDTWLQNPWKKSYFLLRELDAILASVLDNRLSIDDFRLQLWHINTRAHTLAVGNGIQVRLENFLTDGRFALFVWTNNSQFASIYQAISDEVGKAPVTAHARLLQRLSDIYSRNLISQKKDLMFSRIDIYAPTVLELENTLTSSDIEQRDYFDIALYAFSMLQKIENNNFFIESALYESSTYSLIKIILVSTDRYVKAIADEEHKTTTYQSIALHFYEHMLGILVRSVYHTFMVEEGWYIYLTPALRPTSTEPKIRMSEAIVRDLQGIDGVLSLTSDRLDEQYGKDSKNTTFLSIKKSIALFHGFVKILDYESYSAYIRDPYLLDKSSNTLLPVYTENDTILTATPITPLWVGWIVTVDPAIKTIIGLLGNIPQSDIIRDGVGYRINQTRYQFTDKKSGEKLEIAVSLEFDNNVSKFGNIRIQYRGNSILFWTDKKQVSELGPILASLPVYISRYNQIMKANPSLSGEIRFIEGTKKIIIGIYPFDLTPSI